MYSRLVGCSHAEGSCWRPRAYRKVPLSPWRYIHLHAPPAQRVAASLGVTVLVLVLLLLVVEARVFSALPAYPAVALVFGAVVLVPGLFVQRPFLATRSAGPIEWLLLALPFGLAIAAPSGLIVLRLELDLQTFMRLHILLAALVSGAATLFAPDAEPREPAPVDSASNRGYLLLASLLAVALSGVLVSPLWLGDRVSRDFDDWTNLTYVNSYVTRDKLSPKEPVVVQATVAKAADVPPSNVLLHSLPPLMTVFALGATFVLAAGLFRNFGVALLAVAFQLGYALLDLSPDEGFGRDLLLRISEDKMVGAFILFPLGLALISRFLARPEPRVYAAIWLLSFALFAVHPYPLMSLAIALGAVVVLQALVSRSIEPLRLGVLVSLPLIAFAVAHALLWYASEQPPTGSPGSFTTFFRWRGEFNIVRLGGLIMGNYHLILHPLVLGALVLAPVAWLRARRVSGNQWLLATTLGWLPLFFVPPLAALLAKFAHPVFVTRLPWIAPIAIVWAYVTYEALRPLNVRREVHPSMLHVALMYVAPVMLVTAVLGGALIVQESFVRADGGAFYTWTSAEPFLPGTERSIFLGGKDRLLSGQWQLTQDDKTLFDYLRTKLPRGSVVLAPEDTSVYLPGVAAEIKPARSRAIAGMWDAPPYMIDFYDGRLRGLALEQEIERAGVDYVVVREVSNATASLRELSRAQWVVELGPYDIYAFR